MTSAEKISLTDSIGKFTVIGKRIYRPGQIPTIHFSLLTIHFFPIAFPPPITNNPQEGKRCKCEVNNASIEGFGRLFAQLLRSTGADRTLRIGCAG
jgi:hypothetical protein